MVIKATENKGHFMLEIYKRHLFINLKDYENIGIDLEIGLVLLAFAVGLIAATVLITLQRNSMIALVKRLTRVEATSEKGAKTLTELGFTGFRGFMCRILLRGSGRLKRLVRRRGEPEYTYEEYIELTKKRKRSGKKNAEADGKGSDALDAEKPNFKTDAFYLKDKDSPQTKNLLEARVYPLINTILFCVFVFAVYVCISLFLPDILNLVNNALKK